MLKKPRLGIGAVVALFCVVIFGHTTSATSVYDNAYQKSDGLVVAHPSEPACQDVDLSINWASYILDPSKWANPGDANNISSAMSRMRESFQAAVADQQYGTWVLSQVDYGGGNKGVRVIWTQEPNSYLQWQTGAVVLRPFVHHVTILCNDQMGDFTSDYRVVAHEPSVNQSGRSISEADGSVKNWFISSNDSGFNYSIPIGYEGDSLSTVDSGSDIDGDELTREQEFSQGTLDIKRDTDGDGIDDFRESTWLQNWDEIFCGIAQCAYPDPTNKDIYVEIDWMKDGSTTYKPTTTQLDLVRNAFDDKNINIHFDTGEYGGGNELAIYEEELTFMPSIGQADLYDIKNGSDSLTANFSSDRKDIWRYMLTGNRRDTLSTGAAIAGNDDIFIAIGRVRDLHSSGQDNAIAGTIIHELGHSLCLSDELSYSAQDLSCVFAGVDETASTNYVSAMNYYYQFSLVNYSNGMNGASDHDDWSAIQVGIDDFVGKTDPVESLSRRGGIEQQPED